MEKMGYIQAAKRRYDDADRLLNNEPSMRQKMAELEQGEPAVHPEGIELKVQKQPAKPVQKPKKLAIIRGVFTKKSVWMEFIRFVRNGFKIKQND